MERGLKMLMVFAVAASLLMVLARATPDSDSVDPPPPGLAYGGIPYGSMSGNVAEYFRRLAAPSVQQRSKFYSPDVNQYLVA